MKAENDKVLEMIETFSKLKRQGLSSPIHNQLKPSEMAILCCIYDNTNDSEKKELKPSQISGLMNVQQPTVTPLLRSLEEKGLIIRRNDNIDRRQVYYALQEESCELVRLHKKKRYKLLEGLFEYLGKEDTEKLINIMKKSVDYLMQIDI